MSSFFNSFLRTIKCFLSSKRSSLLLIKENIFLRPKRLVALTKSHELLDTYTIKKDTISLHNRHFSALR